MPSAASNDRRHLEKHGDKWRVTIAVPRDLQSRLGTRLKQDLGTDSLAAANRMKWRVVEQLRDRISRERLGNVDDAAGILKEAIAVQSQLRQATDASLERDIERIAEQRAYAILGAPIRVEHDDGGDFPVFDQRRERLAKSYLSVARGGGTPLKLHYPAYCRKLKVSRRTLADDQRALEFLVKWCEASGIRDDVAAITTKVAKAFVEELSELAGGIQPRTVKKYVSRLTLYWGHMVYKEWHDQNPWKSVIVENAGAKIRH